MSVLCIKKVEKLSVDFVTKYTTDSMKKYCMKELTQVRSPLCVMFVEKRSVGKTVCKDRVNCTVINHMFVETVVKVTQVIRLEESCLHVRSVMFH